MERQGRCCVESGVSGCYFIANQASSIVKREQNTFSVHYRSVSGRLVMQLASFLGALQGAAFGAKGCWDGLCGMTQIRHCLVHDCLSARSASARAGTTSHRALVTALWSSIFGSKACAAPTLPPFANDEIGLSHGELRLSVGPSSLYRPAI